MSLRLPLYRGASPEDGAEQGVVPAAVLHRDKPSYIAIVTVRSVSTPLCGDALCTQAGALYRTPSIQPWWREINHAKCIHIYISKKFAWNTKHKIIKWNSLYLAPIQRSYVITLCCSLNLRTFPFVNNAAPLTLPTVVQMTASRWHASCSILKEKQTIKTI